MTRVKLWKVHFQNPRYSDDHDYITVHAPNASCAIYRACKLTYLTPKRDRRKMVDNVELIGVSEK